MAGKKRKKIHEQDVTGLKYFDRIAPLLQRLHDDACQRDKAANRELHFDQYCMLILLYLFNPVVSSLRAIVQASELKKVQRKLGCKRASLGSLSEALPLLVEAMQLNHEKGSGLVKWRLHAQFDIEKYVPTRIDVTRNGGGENDERAVLERTLESNRCYVKDRGYAKFTLFNGINVKRGKYKGGSTGPGSDGLLRIATNLLDVPAEIIALIFRYRWTIEIFFRFFKHVLGCRHLLSHSANGIEIQTYMAIIACMLISLWTGRKPTLRTYEMICYYFTGLADKEELIAHIAKLKLQDQ
jgi:hypothetical protein